MNDNEIIIEKLMFLIDTLSSTLDKRAEEWKVLGYKPTQIMRWRSTLINCRIDIEQAIRASLISHDALNAYLNSGERKSLL